MEPNKHGRIVVIGELNVDLVATGLKSLPAMGTEILARDFDLTLGSASAIFACGVSRLGLPVTFISKVGADYFGDFCIEALRRYGVSTDHITRDPIARTGVTIVLSNRTDRAMVTYPGAIAQLRYEELSRGFLQQHQHLHMTSYYLQEGLRKTFAQIFRAARQSGLTTSFDPNCDTVGAWGTGIRKVFAHTDVLFVNEMEARKLTGQKDLKQALKSLGQDTSCVVIKRGPKGATAIQGQALTSVPGFKVRAVDTTGAGDSFDAGFVSGYIKGLSIQECLEIGNACGALSTLRAGGTAGQPDQATVKKLLKSRVAQR